MEIRENHSLKSLNTFGVDAQARYFVKLENLEDAIKLKRSGLLKDYPCFILGGGSNVLFTDDYEGVIIQMAGKGIGQPGKIKDRMLVKAAAGENWHSLVEYCISHDLGGLENLSLIPGNVGAAPIQNIGAYGVEQQDVFYELTAFDLEKAKPKKFRKKDCNFAYRNSIFKKDHRNKYLILDVTYSLSLSHTYQLGYAALDKVIRERHRGEINLKVISGIVSEIRNSKLPDPELLGNAGSFFKNPVIQQEAFSKLRSAYPEVPAYKLEGQQFKIAAGWLIEQLGWKGKRMGDAGVHENQALVIVNYGEATGREIFEFSEAVRMDVKKHFDIDLEREVILL
ncbi:MAG: UDP-N-acetylmuramate dehydrogenase [Bacteroidota bacterium]|nr:UDP-N-acetylmuramate dehydrogenase [Bacteroidota bacterium]